MFEETILADVVAAREEDHRLPIGRNHQLQANTADIRLNLMIEFLAQLLGVLLTILATLITHLLYQIDCVILNAVLHVHLLPDLLLLPLLVPNAPLLAMLPRLLVLHWIIIMIRVTARNSPLGFRAVSLMD